MKRSGITTAPAASTRNGESDSELEDKVFASVTSIGNAVEPERIGEVGILIRDGVYNLGRDGAGKDDVIFSRIRPGHTETCGAPSGDTLSREQLRFELRDGETIVENVGRLDLRVNGVSTKTRKLQIGDVITIVKHSSYLYAPRAVRMRPLAYPKFDFGAVDPFGMVGESDAMWALRRDLVTAAAFDDDHVLLHGETGTGKELVARAIHALCSRMRGPFFVCNVAALPSGLVTAEVFGNRKNHPNPGMEEHAGFIGAAEHGVLFLDEIGEVPSEVLAAFLRVFDPHATYSRLGESRVRQADVRFVCATNRDLATVKNDFVARCLQHVELPSTEARRADIPLIVRHLVMSAAKVPGSPAAPFVRDGKIAFSEDVIRKLVRGRYETNMRALARAVRNVITSSSAKDGVLRGDPKVVEATFATQKDASADAIRAALARHGGNQTDAASDLGMSRHVLRRLMEKLEIA